MIRKIVGALVLVPLAILMVLFAVANRASIVLSFDPFSSDAPASVARVPLFLALLAALIVGVVVGGVAAWLKQAKSRRAARRLERDLRAARAQAQDLQRRLDAAESQASPPPSASIASIAYRRPPAA